MKKLILILLFAGTVISLNAQHCYDFHRSNCYPSDNEFFEYNGQSKSALFAKGTTSTLNVVIYKGQDYRFSFCLEDHLGDRVVYKIMDGKSKEVLYDNASDEYADTFEFSCEYTRKIIVEMTIPDDGHGGEQLKPKDMGCLGFLIEHMPTPRSGF